MMDERRQGSICFVVGLLALAGYLLLVGNEPMHWAPPSRPSEFVARSLEPAMEARENSSWRRVYHGSLQRLTPTTTQDYEWTVSVYSVPVEIAAATVERAYVIHSLERPQSVGRGQASAPETVERVAVYYFDTAGRPIRSLKVPNMSSSARALECLIAMESTNHSDCPMSPGNSGGEWRGPSGTRWSYSSLSTTSIVKPTRDSLNSIDVEGSAGVKPSTVIDPWYAWVSSESEDDFFDVSQQVRVVQDSEQKGIARLVLQGRQNDNHVESRWTGSLDYLQQISLSASAAQAMSEGLQVWTTIAKEQDRLVSSASQGNAISSHELSLQLTNLNQRAIQLHSQQKDPTIALAIEQSFVQQSAISIRLQAASDQGTRLRDSVPVDWCAADIQGNDHCQAHYRDRVCILGFVSDTRPESIQLLAHLARVRRNYSDNTVAVLNAVSLSHGVKASLIDGLQEAGITVVADDPLAQRFGIESVGLPAFVVLDGRSRFVEICPWNQGQSFDATLALIDDLVQQATAPSATRLTSYGDPFNNRGQSDPIRWENYGHGKQTTNGTELFGMATGAIGKLAPSVRGHR